LPATGNNLILVETTMSESEQFKQTVEPALPLPMLRSGERARVSRLLPAGNGCMRQLSAMGIFPGVVLTVLNTQGGALLVRIGEGRFAIGRGIAQRVLVTPCN